MDWARVAKNVDGTRARQTHYRKWAREGLAQVQDATAETVVDRLELHAGLRVLDCCAGRGTKTLQMREQVGGGGQIIAKDPSENRCRDLTELIHHRRIENMQVVQAGQMAQVP